MKYPLNSPCNALRGIRYKDIPICVKLRVVSLLGGKNGIVVEVSNYYLTIITIYDIIELEVVFND